MQVVALIIVPSSLTRQNDSWEQKTTSLFESISVLQSTSLLDHIFIATDCEKSRALEDSLDLPFVWLKPDSDRELHTAAHLATLRLDGWKAVESRLNSDITKVTILQPELSFAQSDLEQSIESCLSTGLSVALWPQFDSRVAFRFWKSKEGLFRVQDIPEPSVVPIAPIATVNMPRVELARRLRFFINSFSHSKNEIEDYRFEVEGSLTSDFPWLARTKDFFPFLQHHKVSSLETNLSSSYSPTVLHEIPLSPHELLMAAPDELRLANGDVRIGNNTDLSSATPTLWLKPGAFRLQNYFQVLERLTFLTEPAEGFEGAWCSGQVLERTVCIQLKEDLHDFDEVRGYFYTEKQERSGFFRLAMNQSEWTLLDHDPSLSLRRSSSDSWEVSRHTDFQIGTLLLLRKSAPHSDGIRALELLRKSQIPPLRFLTSSESDSDFLEPQSADLGFDWSGSLHVPSTTSPNDSWRVLVDREAQV